MKTTWNKLASTGSAVGLALTLIVGGMAGCTSTPSNRTTGQYIDDKVVTERVEDALQDNPVYKLGEVTVATFSGTVQLSGFVNSAEQKAKAGDIAEKVAGVKNVQNNITVKPATNESNAAGAR